MVSETEVKSERRRSERTNQWAQRRPRGIGWGSPSAAKRERAISESSPIEIFVRNLDFRQKCVDPDSNTPHASQVILSGFFASGSKSGGFRRFS